MACFPSSWVNFVFLPGKEKFDCILLSQKKLPPLYFLTKGDWWKYWAASFLSLEVSGSVCSSKNCAWRVLPKLCFLVNERPNLLPTGDTRWTFSTAIVRRMTRTVTAGKKLWLFMVTDTWRGWGTLGICLKVYLFPSYYFQRVISQGVSQPSPKAFSLAPSSAQSLGRGGRVSLGDVTVHGPGLTEPRTPWD